MIHPLRSSSIWTKFVCHILALGLAIFVLPLFSGNTYAKVLETSDVRQAKKVAIFVGTFDPPTTGHYESVLKVLEDGEMDAVIVLPNNKITHKEPLPLNLRLELWQSLAADNPRILVPSSGVFRLLQESRGYLSPEFRNHLLAINPELKVYVMAGSDVIQRYSSRLMFENAFRPSGWLYLTRANVSSAPADRFFGKPVKMLEVNAKSSSSATRRLLHENRDLYFASEEKQLAACEDLSLPPAVCLEVFSRGLYLGKEDSGQQGLSRFLKRKIKSAFYGILVRLGLYERFKDLFVRWAISQASLSEVLASESSLTPHLKILKALGRGMTSTAYLVEINGNKVVLKIPHATEVARRSLQRTIETSLWLNSKTDIPGAQLVDFDEHGRWALYEFVQGEDLKRILSNATPGRHPLSPQRLNSLQSLFNKVVAIKARSGIFLDFAPDNIVFRGDIAHLIDHGQTAMEQPLVSLEAEMTRWQRIYQLDAAKAVKAQVDCEQAVFTDPR